MAAQLDPKIRSQLVDILYSATPQVVSSTMGTVLLASLVWWRTHSLWTASIVAVSIVVMIARICTLLAYRWKNAGATAPLSEAPVWERRYGAGSAAMAVVIGAVLLAAFLQGDAGTQLLSSGVAIGICGGQSTTRVTCRAWIPILSGTIILGTLTFCTTIWRDSLAWAFTFFVVLYLYTYIEACRHSAHTILGRLVAEAEVAGQARRDPLTGLANRLGFEEELARALRAFGRHRTDVSLLMLDLDGFKDVNDALGHPAGDATLRIVADRLRGVSRRSDHVARLGGDEFAIVVTDPHDRRSLERYARRLIDGISEPMALADTRARIGVSIGIATAVSSSGTQAEELIGAADAALYAVKKGGKNGIAFAADDPAPAGAAAS